MLRRDALAQMANNSYRTLQRPARTQSVLDTSMKCQNMRLHCCPALSNTTYVSCSRFFAEITFSSFEFFLSIPNNHFFNPNNPNFPHTPPPEICISHAHCMHITLFHFRANPWSQKNQRERSQPSILKFTVHLTVYKPTFLSQLHANNDRTFILPTMCLLPHTSTNSRLDFCFRSTTFSVPSLPLTQNSALMSHESFHFSRVATHPIRPLRQQLYVDLCSCYPRNSPH